MKTVDCQFPHGTADVLVAEIHNYSR